jgi:hypothetical protein
VAELRALDLPVGTVIVNQTQPPLLADGKVTQSELKKGLAEAGLAADKATVTGLVSEARRTCPGGRLSRRCGAS